MIRKSHEGYHTALNDAPSYHRRAKGAYLDDGTVFQYDLYDRAPSAIFGRAQVFYSDLPWQTGFAKFEARAGVSGRSFPDFLDAVRWHIEYFGKPAVMVTGQHAARRLQPERVYKTRLNGDPALALCWGLELDNPRNILPELADRYAVGGDFCCGYGRTGRAFRDAGGQFVMSDYNLSCIGYIADHF